jgi:hypothetical protein
MRIIPSQMSLFMIDETTAILLVDALNSGFLPLRLMKIFVERGIMSLRPFVIVVP